MKKLRKAVSFSKRIFNAFMGKDLPNPVVETVNNHPDVYYC